MSTCFGRLDSRSPYRREPDTVTGELTNGAGDTSVSSPSDAARHAGPFDPTDEDIRLCLVALTASSLGGRRTVSFRRKEDIS